MQTTNENTAVKKIYIIPPQYLPVPAVKGGAVETLIELFIKENEKRKEFDIVCFSTKDKRAEKCAKDYRFTHFVYINNFRRFDKLKYQISRISNKIFGVRPYFLDTFHGEIYKYIKIKFENREFIPDAIFVEGGSNINEMKKISKLIGSDKMFLHVHRNLTKDHYDYSFQSAVDYFDHLIAVSSYTESTWNRNRKFKESTVVPNAIDLSYYNILNEQQIYQLRTELGYKENDFVVLFCGRLVEVKGIRELMQAIININKPEVKLLVVGSSNFEGAELTPFQRDIHDKAKKAGNRIKFTGFIHNTEIHRYYSIAQVVVVPSIYEDPFTLVKIEAMASGKPLVISNSGGIPEYIPSNGRIEVIKEREDFIAQIKNAILKLYDDRELCTMMGEANLNGCKQLSGEDYYKNIANATRNK